MFEQISKKLLFYIDASFRSISGDDYTVLVSEYLRNSNVIMSIYFYKKLIKTHW